jgi:hypothetical protein
MPSGRLPLWIIAALVGMVLAAGTGVAFVMYSRATEVDRSTPTIAVRQFLGAVFLDQSDERVRLFTCPEWTPDRTAGMRRRFDSGVKVSWGAITEQSRVDNQAQVATKIGLRYPGELAPSGQQLWRFWLREDKGWRVCDAQPA